MSVSRTNIRKITLTAMLISVLIVLGLVNIPQPAGLSITFNDTGCDRSNNHGDKGRSHIGFCLRNNQFSSMLWYNRF